MEVKTFSTLPRTPAPASRPERPPPPRMVSRRPLCNLPRPRALLPPTLSNRRPPSAALRAPPREEEEEEGELPDIPLSVCSDFVDLYFFVLCMTLFFSPKQFFSYGNIVHFLYFSMDACSDEEDDDGHSSEELEEFEYVDPCKPGACKARKRWKRKRRQRKERRWYNYR